MLHSCTPPLPCVFHCLAKTVPFLAVLQEDPDDRRERERRERVVRQEKEATKRRAEADKRAEAGARTIVSVSRCFSLQFHYLSVPDAAGAGLNRP